MSVTNNATLITHELDGGHVVLQGFAMSHQYPKTAAATQGFQNSDGFFQVADAEEVGKFLRALAGSTHMCNPEGYDVEQSPLIKNRPGVVVTQGLEHLSDHLNNVLDEMYGPRH